ncbi:MAG TPA: alpha/beta fold hydrolase [Anaeromyxobacteraceae bacterium]|nr:alpha/beta fold hydrolase [Anaeromyxobacteraceae bacterium]
MRPGTRLFAMATCLVGFAAWAASAGTPEEKGSTFETAGLSIWFEVLGDGPGTPLVVANGGPGFDHGYMHCSPAWDRLARARKVVFYDQRGNGRSSPMKDGVPCGLAEQVADLDALRGHLGLAKIDLLGHSWGGYLAMAYAARHPERMAHLLIVDSAAPKIQDTAFLFKNIYPEKVSRQDAVAFAVELGDEKAIAADLHEYMSMLFYSSEARDAFLARSKSFVFRQRVNKAVWGDLQRFDLNPELPKFRFPTLVVTGRYDFNVAPSVAWAIHRAIPGSELAVFEKSGHLPFCEEVDGFVTRVQAFLAK